MFCTNRKCKKYKIKIEYEMKEVRRMKYKLVACNTAAHGRCRVPDG